MANPAPSGLPQPTKPALVAVLIAVIILGVYASIATLMMKPTPQVHLTPPPKTASHTYTSATLSISTTTPSALPFSTSKTKFVVEAIGKATSSNKPQKVLLFRPSVEATKEATSREKFQRSFLHKSPKQEGISAHVVDQTAEEIHLSFAQSLLKVAKELVGLADWVFLLQSGAVFGSPLNTPKFDDVLDNFGTKMMVLYEHCHQKGTGSLLIPKQMAPQLQDFVASLDATQVNNDDLVWKAFVAKFGTVLARLKGLDIFTCDIDWLGSLDTAEFGAFTKDDRISADTFRLSADYYYGDMPLPELMHESLGYGYVTRIMPDSVIENIITRDNSVIYVDAWHINEFISFFGQRIKKKFVVLSGDGDECGPECQVSHADVQKFTASPYLLHWYVNNCKGTEQSNKIECFPIGMKQWDNHRVFMQQAYERGSGLKDGIEWKKMDLSTKNEKYILVSFSVETNPEVRKPVHDSFCATDTKNPLASLATCNFSNQMSQLELYENVIGKSRFVVSPHGRGLDCYRTYESLFMNVIPIVKKSSLDSIYKGLPVLILKDWSELSVELMEKTEKEFGEKKWDFRKLYVDYWYHKMRGSQIHRIVPTADANDSIPLTDFSIVEPTFLVKQTSFTRYSVPNYHLQEPMPIILSLFSTTKSMTELSSQNKFISEFRFYTGTEVDLVNDFPGFLNFLKAVNGSQSEWMFYRESGAIFANKLDLPPFVKQLDSWKENSRLVHVFKHCNEQHSGSVLVHASMKQNLGNFAQFLESKHPNTSDSTAWSLFTTAFAPLLFASTGLDLFTCQSFWLGSLSVDNFAQFTMNDRISADTTRLTADFYYGDMPIPASIKRSLQTGRLLRITKASDVEPNLIRNGSVVFVDSWSVGDFIRNIAPHIKTRFTMNCKGIEAGGGKISCIPIGMSQWGDKREVMQKVYENGIGLVNGLQFRKVDLAQKLEKYALVSFSIDSNKKIRQPVFDLFCGANSTHPTTKVMNCVHSDQMDFYSNLIAKSRFVISPHGFGLDCYRTYEALLLSTIPIVKTSSLDPLYENLPVLILKDWEDLSVEMMEETERKFQQMEWNFRKLYADYWFHFVRSKLDASDTF
ncbi:hypothetical protein HDU82_006013 [Entophlyctis luteolus]|nr:hypothetical protein HDU82_006013 [Entophlyctis luteolus]